MGISQKIRNWKSEHESLIREFRYTLYLIKKSPLTLTGFILTSAYISIAIFGPFFVEDAIYKMDLTNRLQPPSFTHPFGTDDLGRDIFSRVIYGFRISLIVGLTVLSIAVCLGVALGLFAGYFGGVIGEVTMRVTDIFLAFPSIVLALALAAALGRGLISAILSLALTWWPWYTRLIYGQVLSLRERPYVEASKAIGASDLHIIFRHILPNCIGPVIVNASMDFGFAILATASLGFLGIGAQPPQPEWGLMVSIGARYIMDNWWYATFPGLAIAITVLSWNLLGDGLRDVLDPRHRRS